MSNIVKVSIGETEAVQSPVKISRELTKRPYMVQGKTYKATHPEAGTFYVTINDVIEDGKRKPVEIFINSKNMEAFQWIVALTRVMSAVFRQSDDPTFLVEELRSIFDPRGGHWRAGHYIPSVIAEIGNILADHIGVSNKSLKQKEFFEKNDMPIRTCKQCGSTRLEKSEGCDKCLDCGWSKCD